MYFLQLALTNVCCWVLYVCILDCYVMVIYHFCMFCIHHHLINRTVCTMLKYCTEYCVLIGYKFHPNTYWCGMYKTQTQANIWQWCHSPKPNHPYASMSISTLDMTALSLPFCVHCNSRQTTDLLYKTWGLLVTLVIHHQCQGAYDGVQLVRLVQGELVKHMRGTEAANDWNDIMYIVTTQALSLSNLKIYSSYLVFWVINIQSQSLHLVNYCLHCGMD